MELDDVDMAPDAVPQHVMRMDAAEIEERPSGRKHGGSERHGRFTGSGQMRRPGRAYAVVGGEGVQTQMLKLADMGFYNDFDDLDESDMRLSGQHDN